MRRDDLVGAVLRVVAPAAGELDRGLDRLRAGVAEEHAVEARVLDEQLGELDHRLRVVEVRGVDQRLRLLGERLRDHGVRVAEDVHGEAADEVEVLVALRVPDARAFATFEDDGLPAVVLEDVLPFLGDPVGHRSIPSVAVRPPAGNGTRAMGGGGS